MARPRKEGLSYFPHDVDAASDPKIDALRSILGNEGYAVYFLLLEKMYREKDGELDVSKNIFKRPLLKYLMIDEAFFDEFLDVAFEAGVFSRENYEKMGRLSCHGVKKRLETVNEKREAWRNKKNVEETEVFPEENAEDNGVFPAENTEENATKESKEKNKDLSTTTTTTSTTGEAAVLDEIVNGMGQAAATGEMRSTAAWFYERNFGMLNSYISGEMIKWLDEYDDDVLVFAMEIALSKNLNKWSSVNTILKGWFTRAAVTLNDCQALEAEWVATHQMQAAKSKGSPQNRSSKNNKPKPAAQQPSSGTPMTQAEMDEIRAAARKLDSERSIPR